MAQTQKVSGTATKVIKETNAVSVRYHTTIVAKVADEGVFREVTLNSNGWRTNTTKTRINQFANEFCNGAFHVYQKAGDWFVAFGYAPGDVVLPFADGMAFRL